MDVVTPANPLWYNAGEVKACGVLRVQSVLLILPRTVSVVRKRFPPVPGDVGAYAMAANRWCVVRCFYRLMCIFDYSVSESCALWV